MIKILQMSDLHFQSKHLDDKIRCFEEILDKAMEWKPDLAAVPGDLYDRSLRMEDRAARESARLFGELANLCPILIARGNYSHDRQSVEILRHVKGKYPIHVSTEPEVIWFSPKRPPCFVSIPLSDLASMPPQVPVSETSEMALLFTLPYPSSSFLAALETLGPEALREAVSRAITQIIRGFAAIPTGLPRILLFHGTVSGCKSSESQHMMGMDIELTLADIEACGFDLVAAGHIHFKQQMGERVFYAGGLTADAFGEDLPKGCWLHMLEKVSNKQGGSLTELHSEFMSVSAVPMRTWDVDLTDSIFIAPPEWAQEYCDLRVKVKVKEGDLGMIPELPLKQWFPNARNIVVQKDVQLIDSVRCEAVRAAQSLKDKIQVWCEYAKVDPPPGLFRKAELLEAVNDADEIVKEMERHDESEQVAN